MCLTRRKKLAGEALFIITFSSPPSGVKETFSSQGFITSETSYSFLSHIIWVEASALLCQPQCPASWWIAQKCGSLWSTSTQPLWNKPPAPPGMRGGDARRSGTSNVLWYMWCYPGLLTQTDFVSVTSVKAWRSFYFIWKCNLGINEALFKHNV